MSIDISGLGRLFGNARTIGEALRRQAAARGIRMHVAIAGTRTAALILALARPGLTVIEPGAPAATLSVSEASARGSLEPLRSAKALSNSAGGGAPARLNDGGAPREVKDVASALAAMPIGILEKVHDDQTQSPRSTQSADDQKDSACSAVSAFKRWGLRTLGELAALPPADLAARLGRPGLVWQAIARGEDARPLVPTLPEERFESSIDLEWPIEGLEPVSFALTRLLEPLSTRLERRDRGAAVLHVRLRLVSHEIHARSLRLPSPIRDVRTLRTLALLDLESHPPGAAIDRITVVIDPTPGRVWQHTLFTRAQPAPEQLSTLLARLGALMGQDRLGAPVAVDSHVPGAFAMTAFGMIGDTRARESTLEREVLRASWGWGPSERSRECVESSATSARSKSFRS